MGRKFVCFFIGMLFWLSACAPSAPESVSIPTSTPSPGSEITATSTPDMSCHETHGHFEFQQIQTSLMTHPLVFRVYLPACYGNDPSKKFPVLYLLHGQGFNDDQWDRLGADEALDNMVAAGEIPPFILVLPRESNYMVNQWQSKYGKALAAELVPWVDAHYQTCADRSCRAIGGISRGSGWAMRIALMNWPLFSAVGAHSFAPFRGDFNALLLWLKAIPSGQLPRIWIDVGDRDFISDAAVTWKNRLDDYQVPNDWHVLPGSHTEKRWAAYVSTYLRWYAAGWKNFK